MKYRYRIDIKDQRRLSPTKRESIKIQLNGELDLVIEPRIGESVKLRDVHTLKITDIVHISGDAPLLVLDGSTL